MWKRLAKIALCLLSMAIVLYDVYFSRVDIFTFILYLFSIAMCLLAIKDFKATKAEKHKDFKKDIAILIPLILLQLLVLNYFSNVPSHYHWDEFIEAYTSYSLPPVQQLNWVAGYPQYGWVARFPVLFFILQKPFLTIFGPSVESMRASVWPYHIFILIFLYALAKELFASRFFAFITSAVHIFFAPNLYISSIAVHFVSSTLFLLASLYYLLKLFKTYDKKHSILCGVFIALSYLTYPASYVALPLVILFTIIEARQQSWRIFRLLVPALLICIIILLPFVTYALVHQNYFAERASQISFLSGTRSDTLKKVEAGENMSSLLMKQLATNIKSLYTPGIGGVDGYLFGRQAFFNLFTFVLFLAGFIACLYHAVRDKRTELLYVLITIIAAFVLGMVLNVPPAGFHRISVIFPFIALVIAIAIYTAGLFAKCVHKALGTLIPVCLIAVFVLTNFTSALGMARMPGNDVIKDDSLYITNYIQDNLPQGAAIQVLAPPAYHLQRELFFRTHNKYNLTTSQELKQPTHAIIILWPSKEKIDQLMKTFPEGAIIERVDDMQLTNHTIFVPNI